MRIFLANFPTEIVQKFPKAFPNGIYYGWANVESGEVYKMVMSVGFNPQFHNEVKTIVRRIKMRTCKIREKFRRKNSHAFGIEK